MKINLIITPQSIILKSYLSSVSWTPVSPSTHLYNPRLLLHSVALGMLEVRDRKSELPTCLHSDQLGTLNLERVAR